jgi:hypothetical protein
MTALFITHWFQFNYAEPGQPFYRAADWPNVFVVLPLAILGYLYLRSRHIAVIASHEALKAAHVEHAAKLDKLLDRFDPTTQGGVSDVLDRLDVSTPGGITIVSEKIDELLSKAPAIETTSAKPKPKLTGRAPSE